MRAARLGGGGWLSVSLPDHRQTRRRIGSGRVPAGEKGRTRCGWTRSKQAGRISPSKENGGPGAGDRPFASRRPGGGPFSVRSPGFRRLNPSHAAAGQTFQRGNASKRHREVRFLEMADGWPRFRRLSPDHQARLWKPRINHDKADPARFLNRQPAAATTASSDSDDGSGIGVATKALVLKDESR
jgi:hypothetical protein